jgi:hypothetical protein
MTKLFPAGFAAVLQPDRHCPQGCNVAARPAGNRAANTTLCCTWEHSTVQVALRAMRPDVALWLCAGLLPWRAGQVMLAPAVSVASTLAHLINEAMGHHV